MSNAPLGVTGHFCKGEISATGFERWIKRYLRPPERPRLIFGIFKRSSLVEMVIIFID